MTQSLLLIEDSPGHGEDILRALGPARCRIERMLAGPEAFERARESKPDLLVADVSLSNGAALKTAESLGWVDGLPCIIVSELPFLATEHSMASMTFLKWVFWRPYSKEALRESVEKVLDMRVEEVGSRIFGGA
jgi:DNA-binding NtrC family response regulator